MDYKDNPELLSALADGELHDDALAGAIRLAADDAAGRDAWRSYHLIGEVLRTGAAATGHSVPDQFLARLQQRLESEQAAPAVVVPGIDLAPAVMTEAAPAANDRWWKVVAGLASVTALGAVAWNLWSSQAAAQPQMAAAPPAPAVAQADSRSQAAMIRDPRLDQLLAAHRQLGGAGALQTSSGFLRNATYEGPAR